MPLPDPATYLAPLFAQLAKSWPDNRNVRLVAHGHSVPAGYFRTPDLRTFDSYPHLLHRLLAERFPTAPISTVVTAIGGEHSESGAARFAEDVLSLRPHLITIDYALNDRGLGLERARVAWTRMLGLAATAQVPVILLTPTFDLRSVPAHDPAASDLLEHTRQIRALASEYGVGLADSFAAWSAFARAHGSYSALMSQCNHPSRRGHELVADELIRWFPAL